jgi:hypothetical protein
MAITSRSAVAMALNRLLIFSAEHGPLPKDVICVEIIFAVAKKFTEPPI